MRDVIPAPAPGLDLRREYGHHQSPAIRAGGMVFCSGVVAIDPQSGERQHGTVTSEARRIFVRSSEIGSTRLRGSHPARNRKFADSPLEGNGFELPVPRQTQAAVPSSGA
jgi:hypothetical protein